MPLTELATLGLESWCDFVLREVFNLLWHLWLCCLIVAQNLLCHLVASLGLGQPEHLHRHFLGHLRDMLPAMESVINVFVSFVVFFIVFVTFSFHLPRPASPHRHCPRWTHAGLPCNQLILFNKVQQGIFKSVANSWFWSPPWWSLHQLDHFLELLGADVDLLLWSKGQHVLWLNAKGRLALWASVFEMSTST